MSSVFQTVKLGDILSGDGLSYGVVQPGMHDPQGVPIVRVGDIKYGRVSTSSPLKIAPEVSKTHNRTVLQGGEVLLSIVGTVGRVAQVNNAIVGWNTARAIAVIRPNNEDDARWIYYVLRSKKLQSAMGIAQTDTVQATLNLRDVRELEIPYPDSQTRLKIAEVLGDLDRLIEVSRELCEEIRELSRSTFAQEVMTSSTYVKLSELAAINPDRVQKAKPEQITYLAIADVNDGSITWPSKTYWPDAPAAARLRVQPGDIIWSRVRPNRRSHARLPEGCGPTVVSTGLTVIRPRAVPSSYLMAVCDSLEFSSRLTALADGTAYPTVDASVFANILVPRISEKRLFEFDQTFGPLVDALNQLETEISLLESTRDSLLPLLLSGAIIVEGNKP
jgi:type I restriction enzyme S subunit